jgi:hypothetical protein
VPDARIHIESINSPFLQGGGSPDEYRAGLEQAIAKGWLTIQRSGVNVKFTEAAQICSHDDNYGIKGWCRRMASNGKAGAGLARWHWTSGQPYRHSDTAMVGDGAA